MPTPGLIMDGAVMQRLLNSTGGPVMRWVLVKGQQVQSLAQAQVGVRTGRLRASIMKRPGVGPSGPYVQVGSNLPYARLHHQGTRPHQITARRTKVLAFYSARAGRVVFARSVQHPGTKPNHYLTDPLRRVVAHH